MADKYFLVKEKKRTSFLGELYFNLLFLIIFFPKIAVNKLTKWNVIKDRKVYNICYIILSIIYYMPVILFLLIGFIQSGLLATLKFIIISSISLFGVGLLIYIFEPFIIIIIILLILSIL